MPFAYALYNLTASPITVDDLPFPVTVLAHASAAIPAGNTQLDVLSSWLIRERVVESELQLSVNGDSIDYKRILHATPDEV